MPQKLCDMKDSIAMLKTVTVSVMRLILINIWGKGWCRDLWNSRCHNTDIVRSQDRRWSFISDEVLVIWPDASLSVLQFQKRRIFPISAHWALSDSHLRSVCKKDPSYWAIALLVQVLLKLLAKGVTFYYIRSLGHVMKIFIKQPNTSNSSRSTNVDGLHKRGWGACNMGSIQEAQPEAELVRNLWSGILDSSRIWLIIICTHARICSIEFGFWFKFSW